MLHLYKVYRSFTESFKYVQTFCLLGECANLDQLNYNPFQTTAWQTSAVNFTEALRTPQRAAFLVSTGTPTSQTTTTTKKWTTITVGIRTARQRRGVITGRAPNRDGNIALFPPASPPWVGPCVRHSSCPLCYCACLCLFDVLYGIVYLLIPS